MIEKVNPSHPDKLADRIAGAIVDLCYTKSENPKVAVEVLLGHGKCQIIIETSEDITKKDVKPIVKRIAGDIQTNVLVVRQDSHLAENQRTGLKCGDNGIFKGVPVSDEERKLNLIALRLYDKYPYDGKFILDEDRGLLIICQSNADRIEIVEYINKSIKTTEQKIVINPLGDWTGGINVDSGATNRKLGSDMGHAVTGGGLHGKDLSKADVSVNIYAYLKAQETGQEVNLCCAIGDETVDGRPYSEIVDIARDYIQTLGGFEALANWGLM